MAWQSQTNKQYGANGEALAIYDLVIVWMQTLGWTVAMSGDGLLLYSAVGNVITSGGGPGLAGAIGNFSAWVVMQAPSGLQFLLQRGPAGTQTYRWLCSVSHGGLYAGGAAAIKPVAADEHGIPADPPAVLLNSFGNDGGANSYYNIIAADAAVNGQWPFTLTKHNVATGDVMGYLYCWAVDDTDPSDTAPIWGHYGENLGSWGWLNTARIAKTIYDPAGAATWTGAYAQIPGYVNTVWVVPGVTAPCPDGIRRSMRVCWWTIPAGTPIWKGRSPDMIWSPDTSDATPWNNLWLDQTGIIHLSVDSPSGLGVLIPGWPSIATCPLPDLGAGVSVADVIVDANANPDVTPPTITVVSPTVGTTIRPSDPFVVDVSDAGGFALIVLTAELPAGGPHEVVWMRGVFAEPYAAGSTISAIADGFRFAIMRKNGWTASPTFHVEAIDNSGNQGT